MLTSSCNPRAQEAEANGWEAEDQSEGYSKTLTKQTSQGSKQNNNKTHAAIICRDASAATSVACVYQSCRVLAFRSQDKPGATTCNSSSRGSEAFDLQWHVHSIHHTHKDTQK